MFQGRIIDTKLRKLSIQDAEKFIASSDFGASIFFSGTVRNQNDNKSVIGITYDTHDALVIQSFEEIYNEANEKLEIKNKAVFIDHAKGYLNLGEISIIIAVATKHREEAYKLSKGRKVLVMYQKLLKEVPNWSDAMSKQHTDNIANRCAWFNDLLAAVFVSCVKILSAVRLSKDNKKISLKLPTNEVFIQMCHNKVAESLYNNF